MSGAVPRLRFPGFEGDWKRSTAGMSFLNRRERGEAGLPIYSVTIDRGLVPRNELDRHLGADAADEANLRAQSDDIVYNTMRMWQGAVGIATEECMVSPAYVVLQPRPETDAAMFSHWFKSRRMLGRLTAYSHGLTTDRLRLYFEDFAQIPLFVPEMKEQRRIATFLGAIDAKIDALRRKQAALVRFKAGLTQKIFSQELRFRREDGSEFPQWNATTLGRVATFSKGRGVSKADVDPNGGIPCVRYGELYTTYGAVIDKVKSRTSLPAEMLVISKGNEVLIPASGETAEDIATASALLRPGVAIGGDVNILQSSENVRFLAAYLRGTLKPAIAAVAQGNSVVHLYANQLRNLEISLPCLEEQHKIADALSAIDIRIASLSAGIKQMETYKRGLLQQMFV